MVNTSVLIYFEQKLAVRINIYFLNIPDTQNNDILWIKMLQKWSKPCNIFNFFSLSVRIFVPGGATNFDPETRAEI